MYISLDYLWVGPSNGFRRQFTISKRACTTTIIIIIRGVRAALFLSLRPSLLHVPHTHFWPNFIDKLFTTYVRVCLGISTPMCLRPTSLRDDRACFFRRRSRETVRVTTTTTRRIVLSSGVFREPIGGWPNATGSKRRGYYTTAVVRARVGGHCKTTTRGRPFCDTGKQTLTVRGKRKTDAVFSSKFVGNEFRSRETVERSNTATFISACNHCFGCPELYILHGLYHFGRVTKRISTAAFPPTIPAPTTWTRINIS